MDKSLARLLLRINCDPLVIDRWQLTGDCDSLWNWCRRHGLLENTIPKQGSLCPDCWEAVPVVSLTSPRPGEEPAFYVSCEECGASRIPAEQVCQWVFNVSKFLETILRDVPRAGTTGAVQPDRWWRLGRARWASGHWNLHFARGLPHELRFSDIEFPPRSVVFIPMLTPFAGVSTTNMPVILPLDQILVWDSTDMKFDQEYVEDQLLAVTSPSPKPKRSVSQKEMERNRKIEAIKQELVQHLIAARDLAFFTQEQTGTPQLLPRPTMAELGHRLGFSESTVSRCLNAEKEGILGQLWDLAVDVHRILAFRPPREKQVS